MCDINKKTKLKKITVYKLAYKNRIKDYKYVSWLARIPIRLGKVPIYPIENVFYDGEPFDFSTINYTNINSNMVGRSSGFKRLSAIKVAIRELMEDFTYTTVILKVVLSGDIMEGTADRISNLIDFSEITYAGTFIESVEEIDIRGRIIDKL